ncbi:MAG: MauE/DoxX family redox-associated membrane protein [Balneolaceae bacterium]
MTRLNLVYSVKWIFRIVLAGVLVLAGILKLQDNTALFETVAYITWLPVWLKFPIVDFLPYMEILLAVLLLLRWQEKVVLPLVGLIFLGFLGFSIYGTATGLEGDCGCFGELMDSTFGPAMIVRNTVLAGMAGFLFWQPVADESVSNEPAPEY